MRILLIVLISIPTYLLSITVTYSSVEDVNFFNPQFSPNNYESFIKLDKTIDISQKLFSIKGLSLGFGLSGSLDNMYSNESVNVNVTTEYYPDGTGENLTYLYNCKSKIYSGYIKSNIDLSFINFFTKAGIHIRAKESTLVDINPWDEEALALDCDGEIGPWEDSCSVEEEITNSQKHTTNKKGTLIGYGVTFKINKKLKIGYESISYYKDEIKKDLRILKRNSILISYGLF